MMPFDTYKTYIALKNHFTQPNYDYQKYCGKIKASVQSFYKRKDRFWFEKLSRNKTDKEIEDFFISNFVMASDPTNLWIGNIIRDGDRNYTEWQKKIQSLSYVFKEETENLFSENKFQEVFECKTGHPKILKSFLSGKISLETLVICDRIFLFGKNFDKKLKDPIWEIVSLKMKKYSPFLNIDVLRYRKILKEIVVGDQ
jgi:hypothetical protein